MTIIVINRLSCVIVIFRSSDSSIPRFLAGKAQPWGAITVRICLYSEKVLPRMGGQELVVDTLARRFHAAGH